MTVWLQITSGHGQAPVECCWVVYQVVKKISDDAKRSQIDIELVDMKEGEVNATCKSAILAIEGDSIDGFLDRWTGTIQWIGKSIFRPNHKRKNWFVGVERFKLPERSLLSDKDVTFETMRSSGPGGQHANKSESAVRATHLPTRISAVAQEERSQYLNRKLALARLLALMEADAKRKEGENRRELWNSHYNLERGNPVKVFYGKSFKLKS